MSIGCQAALLAPPLEAISFEASDISEGEIKASEQEGWPGASSSLCCTYGPLLYIWELMQSSPDTTKTDLQMPIGQQVVVAVGGADFAAMATPGAPAQDFVR